MTVGDMKLYTLAEVLDEAIGSVGTAERDEFDSSVEEAVEASFSEANLNFW